MKCKNCGFEYGDAKFCPQCHVVQPLSAIGMDQVDNPSADHDELPIDQVPFLKGEEQ